MKDCMKRKRFIKLLMAHGVSLYDARRVVLGMAISNDMITRVNHVASLTGRPRRLSMHDYQSIYCDMKKRGVLQNGKL